MMSVQVQQFTPHSKYHISSEKLDLGIEMQDEKIQKIMNNLFKKVLRPILKKDYKKTEPLSDKKINAFTKISISLADALQRKYNLNQLGQSDLEAYENSINRIKNSSWIPKKSKDDALKMIDILMDYSKIIVPIAINKRTLLENAGGQIDLKDLFRALYGSQLAYVCLLVMMNVNEFQNDQRFSIITENGYNFARNLDGYIDTIDILTKPDEDAELKKIK